MAVTLDGNTPINGFSTANSVKYNNSTSGLSATTTQSAIDEIATNVPFKFGITPDGQYGYYKDGADTVTPFKTGGGGGNALHLYTATSTETLYDYFSKGLSTVYLFCDALFKEDFSLSDLVVPSYITNAEYFSRNLIKLTVDADSAKLNPTITIRVKSSGLKFNNGDVETTFDIKSSISAFFDTKDELTVWSDTKTDNNTYTLDLSSFMNIPTNRDILPNSTNDIYNTYRDLTTISLNSDSVIKLTPGYSNGIQFMYQDNAAYYMAYAELVDIDDVGQALKLRYEGTPWRADDKHLYYEFFIIENGDCFVNIIKYEQSSSYIGVWKFNDIDLTVPNEGNSTISFYRRDYLGTNFDIVYEPYDVNNHYICSNTVSPECTLSQIMNDNDSFSWISKTGGDTYSTNFNFDFNFNESSKVNLNGDCSLNNGGKYFYYNYRDGYTNSIKLMNKTLTDLGGVKCCKIMHDCYPQYNDKTEEERQICELYFFSNGDVMLKCIKSATTRTNGSYSCFDKTYDAFVTGDVISFYRKDAEGTDWDIIKEVYDISHHNG